MIFDDVPVLQVREMFYFSLNILPIFSVLFGNADFLQRIDFPIQIVSHFVNTSIGTLPDFGEYFKVLSNELALLTALKGRGGGG